jgi:hypothetical protein
MKAQREGSQAGNHARADADTLKKARNSRLFLKICQKYIY